MAPEHCHILPVVIEHGISLLTTLHSLPLYSNFFAGSSWFLTTPWPFHLLSSTHGFMLSCLTPVFCPSYVPNLGPLCLHKSFWNDCASFSLYFSHVWTCLPHKLLALWEWGLLAVRHGRRSESWEIKIGLSEFIWCVWTAGGQSRKGHNLPD